MRKIACDLLLFLKMIVALVCFTALFISLGSCQISFIWFIVRWLKFPATGTEQ